MMIAMEQRGTLFKTPRPGELHLHENFRRAGYWKSHNERGGDDDFNRNESAFAFLSRRIVGGLFISALRALDYHRQR